MNNKLNNRQMKLEKLYAYVEQMRDAQRNFFQNRNNFCECRELEKAVDQTLRELKQVDHQNQLFD